MRKVLMLAIIAGALQACGSSDQGGVVNDGRKAIDSNAGLADTPYTYKPKIDTAKMEGRVDLSKRDTFDQNPKR